MQTPAVGRRTYFGRSSHRIERISIGKPPQGQLLFRDSSLDKLAFTVGQMGLQEPAVPVNVGAVRALQGLIQFRSHRTHSQTQFGSRSKNPTGERAPLIAVCIEKPMLSKAWRPAATGNET
jgi:hypothetical protein